MTNGDCEGERTNDRTCNCDAQPEGQNTEKKMSRKLRSKGEMMGIYRKGREIGIDVNYDCEGKSTENGGPNVCKLVMHRLMDNTTRKRGEGHGGRKERWWGVCRKKRGFRIGVGAWLWVQKS